VSYLKQSFNEELTNRNIEALGIPGIQEKVDNCKADVKVSEIQWSEDGEAESGSAAISQILGIMLAMFAYFFVLMYGAMIMNGVIEEKTNRIVEVIVSSCRPIELMMGKIIGIGFVGLTQVFLWGILTTVLISGSLFFFGGNASPEEVMNAQMAAQGINNIATNSSSMNIQILEIISSINFKMIGICFILYFIGGYLLYAALFAAIGSALEQQEDSQQFMTPIMILMIFSLYAGIYSMENPDGPLAFWCSMIPLTSPIVMMVRLPFDIPMWELLLSFVLLFATAVFIVWFSAKIYRVGILMYGKKPSIKEMMKWLTYK
jgi:ABC-2 type transport system permease protein